MDLRVTDRVAPSCSTFHATASVRSWPVHGPTTR